MNKMIGLAGLWCLCATPALALRIAVFDQARAAEGAYAVSPVYSQVRAAIQANFPGTTFLEMNTLTAAGVASADVMMITSVSGGLDAVPQLTANEQAVMTGFVASGGMAILVTDNSSFAPDAHASNQSMLNPFGLYSGAYNEGYTDVIVVDFNNPITNGPYGTITQTAYSWAGYFTVVPATFTNLADVVALSGPGIVFSPRNVLGAGYGGVVAFSDCSFHSNDWSPPGQNIILNCMAYGVPANQMSGTCTLQDYFGVLPSIEIEFRPVGGGESIRFPDVPLGAGGTYTLGTRLTGNYEVWAKGPHWLGMLSDAGVVTLSAAVTSVDFVLANGDIDGDNEVGIGDYALLSAAYGSMPGDGHWHANSDLDGDDEVAIGDYAILSGNYGLFGD